MAYDIKLPDGTLIRDIPDNVKPEEARKVLAVKLAGKHGVSAGAATEGSDLLAGGIRGLGATVEMLPNLYTLVTGKDASDSGIAKVAESLKKKAGSMETPLSYVQRQEMDKAIGAAEKEGTMATIYEVAKQYALNPRVLMGKVAEVIPDILVGGGTGLAAKVGTKAAISGIAKNVAKESAEKAATKVAVGTAVGTGAVQEGTSTGKEALDEVYKTIQARNPTMPKEEAWKLAVEQGRLAGLLSAGVSAATSAMLPGVEKTLIRGVGVKDVGLKGAAKGFGKAAVLGEMPQEAAESGTGQLLQNLAVQPYAPEVSTGRGVARATTEGAIIGGIAGGVPGAISGSGILRGEEVAPTAPPALADSTAPDATADTTAPAPTKTFTRAKLSESLNSLKTEAPQFGQEIDQLLLDVEATKGAKPREGRNARAAIAGKIEGLRTKVAEAAQSVADQEANKSNVVGAAVNAGASVDEVSTALNIAGQGETNAPEAAAPVVGGGGAGPSVASVAPALPATQPTEPSQPGALGGTSEPTAPAAGGEGSVSPALTGAKPSVEAKKGPATAALARLLDETVTTEPAAETVAETPEPLAPKKPRTPRAKKETVADLTVEQPKVAAEAAPAAEAQVEEPKIEAKPYRIDKIVKDAKTAWQAVDPETGTAVGTFPTRNATVEAIKAASGKVTTAKNKVAAPVEAKVEAETEAKAETPAVDEEQDALRRTVAAIAKSALRTLENFGLTMGTGEASPSSERKRVLKLAEKLHANGVISNGALKDARTTAADKDMSHEDVANAIRADLQAAVDAEPKAKPKVKPKVEVKPKAAKPVGRVVSGGKAVLENLRNRVNRAKAVAKTPRDVSDLASMLDKLDEIDKLPPSGLRGASLDMRNIHDRLSKIEERVNDEHAAAGAGTATDEELDLVEKNVEGKTTAEVADWIELNGPTAFYRNLAKTLAERIRYLEGLGVKFSFNVAKRGDSGPSSLAENGVGGITKSKSAKPPTSTADKVDVQVWVNGSTLSNRTRGTSFQVVLHELVHAVTATALDHADLDPSLQKFKGELEALFNKVKNQINKDTKHFYKAPPFLQSVASNRFNTMKDIHEMLAWALTNADMQAYMEGIPFTGYTKSKAKTVWSAFVGAVRNLLGLPESNNTALSALLQTAGSLLSADLSTIGIRPDYSRTTPSVSKKGKGGDLLQVKLFGKTVDLGDTIPPPTKKAEREASTRKLRAKAERRANLAQFAAKQPEGHYDRIVRLFQNNLRPIFTLKERMQKAGVEITPEIDLPVAMTNMIGEADATATFRVDKTLFEYRGLLKDFAKLTGVKLKDAVKTLSDYFVALHEPERRETKFYEQVRLSEEGQIERERLMAILGDAKISLQKKIDAYQDLRDLVDNDPVAEEQDIDSSAFDVIGIRMDSGIEMRMNPEMSQKIREETDKFLDSKPGAREAVDKIVEKRKELEAITRQLRTEANFDSKAFADFITARGWQNYVPYQGMPTRKEVADIIDAMEESGSSELIGSEVGFKGRASAAENAILRGMANAKHAAGLKGINRVTSVVRNMIEKGYIKGEVKKAYTFQEGLVDPKKRNIKRAPNVIIHHEKNGDVYRIEIDDRLISRAIRRTYANQFVPGFIGATTRFMGNLFTFYNPVFWVTNFYTDVITNTWKISAESGFKKGLEYYARAVAVDMIKNNSLGRSLRFMRLYNSRKPENKERLAALIEKNDWYRDAAQFVQIGGRSSYRAGLTTAAQQQELMPSGISGAKEAFDNFIAFMPDAFELASRISAFRTIRDLPQFKGNLEAAVAETKNISNFEQSGEYGRNIGALYMFFRPSATGAVAALDAMLKGKHRAAAITLATILGAASYYIAKAFADDDEEGRNRVDTDDPSRWVRGPRFHIPGTDYVFQGRWGFGIGGIASAVAQSIMLREGKMDVWKYIHNMRVIAQESVLPLPVSQMDETDRPDHWLIDSLLPSFLRPINQYGLNHDSLDRQIYQQGPSRYSAAYVAGEGIPEYLKDISRSVFDHFNGEVPTPLKFLTDPKALQFFANNYASGMLKLSSFVDEALRASGLVGEGGVDQKDIDWVKKLPFITTPAQYDMDQFYSKTEKRIEKIDQILNTFKKRNPEKYEEYLDAHPGYEEAVKFFNKAKNGELKELRAEVSQVSFDKSLSPKERAEAVKELRKQQADVMRDITIQVNEMLEE